MTGQPIAMIQWQRKFLKNIRSLLAQDGKMDWSSLIPRTFFFYNQQPGADKTNTSTSPGGQCIKGPAVHFYQGQFEHYLVYILAIKLGPQKNKDDIWQCGHNIL